MVWFWLTSLYLHFEPVKRKKKIHMSLTLHTVSHLKTVKTSDKSCLLIQKLKRRRIQCLLFNRGIIIWVKSQPLFLTRKKSFHSSRSCSACLRIENGSLLYPWPKIINWRPVDQWLLTILNLNVHDCQYQPRCYQNIIHSKLAFHEDMSKGGILIDTVQ